MDNAPILMDAAHTDNNGGARLRNPPEGRQLFVRDKFNGRKVSSPAYVRHPLIREAQDGERLAEQILGTALEADPKFARSEVFGRFLDHVTERRMSKAGRFLRVHFKSGVQIDVVPDGSLASGSALMRPTKGKNQWRFISPNLDRLWRDFAAVRG